MTEERWVTLSEYSNQYKVSVSTLRRRIKSRKVEFVSKDGKYFLADKPLSEHRSSMEAVNNTSDDLTHRQPSVTETKIAPPQPYPKFNLDKVEFDLVSDGKIDQHDLAMNPIKLSPKSQPVSNDVEYLLKELKQAYTLILKEKEEQILLLKDEISDLKMLSRALEQRCDQLEKQLHSAIDKNNEISAKAQITSEPNPKGLQTIQPQPIELDYVPTPDLEMVRNWLDDEI